MSLYFYHLDHLGTPRVITDVNGNVVSRHKYLPFGEELSPPPTTNTHMFTGHERDKETGLDYMLARYYGSGLGRFVSVDPLAASAKRRMPQTWNRYTYTLNNPMIFVDITGEELVFRPGTDPTFVANVTQAIDNAVDMDKTGRVKAAADRVKGSENKHYIAPGDQEGGNPLDKDDATNGKGTGSNFLFKDGGYTDSDGHHTSPEQEAAHMLSHMEDMDSGTRETSSACADCAAKEEVKAVQTQNLVSANDPKTTYDGKQVPDATAPPPPPPPGKKKGQGS